MKHHFFTPHDLSPSPLPCQPCRASVHSHPCQTWQGAVEAAVQAHLYHTWPGVEEGERCPRQDWCSPGAPLPDLARRTGGPASPAPGLVDRRRVLAWTDTRRAQSMPAPARALRSRRAPCAAAGICLRGRIAWHSVQAQSRRARTASGAWVAPRDPGAPEPPGPRPPGVASRACVAPHGPGAPRPPQALSCPSRSRRTQTAWTKATRGCLAPHGPGAPGEGELPFAGPGLPLAVQARLDRLDRGRQGLPQGPVSPLTVQARPRPASPGSPGGPASAWQQSRWSLRSRR